MKGTVVVEGTRSTDVAYDMFGETKTGRFVQLVELNVVPVASEVRSISLFIPISICINLAIVPSFDMFFTVSLRSDHTQRKVTMGLRCASNNAMVSVYIFQ